MGEACSEALARWCWNESGLRVDVSLQGFFGTLSQKGEFSPVMPWPGWRLIEQLVRCKSCIWENFWSLRH